MRLYYPDWQPPRVDAREVAKHPLGSNNNPLRTHGLNGTEDYFSRLRCRDGKTPTIGRKGSGLRGIYGYPVDYYEIRCPSAPSAEVTVDIYHPRFIETEAIPGFTLVR
jgi:hypothetical protein